MFRPEGRKRVAYRARVAVYVKAWCLQRGNVSAEREAGIRVGTAVQSPPAVGRDTRASSQTARSTVVGYVMAVVVEVSCEWKKAGGRGVR